MREIKNLKNNTQEVRYELESESKRLEYILVPIHKQYGIEGVPTAGLTHYKSLIILENKYDQLFLMLLKLERRIQNEMLFPHLKAEEEWIDPANDIKTIKDNLSQFELEVDTLFEEIAETDFSPKQQEQTPKKSEATTFPNKPNSTLLPLRNYGDLTPEERTRIREGFNRSTTGGNNPFEQPPTGSSFKPLSSEMKASRQPASKNSDNNKQNLNCNNRPVNNNAPTFSSASLLSKRRQPNSSFLSPENVQKETTIKLPTQRRKTPSNNTTKRY